MTGLEWFICVVVLPLVTVAIIAFRIALDIASRPVRLDPSIPPGRRLELAKIKCECAMQWIAKSGTSPTGYSLAMRNWRACMADLQQAENDVRALEGRL